MTHAETLEWLHRAISALAGQVSNESTTTSRSGVSGTMLRVSEIDAISRRTTGTDGDDE